MVVYHGVALGFEALDATGRLARFRTRPPERRGYLALLPLVLVNQCLVLLPCMVALEWAGLAYVGVPQLQPWWFAAALLLMAVGHDVVQYAGHVPQHRLSRLRFLGHRIHHSTVASRAVSACYMSPPDFVFQILLPYLVPLVLIGGGGADMLFHVVTVCFGAIGGLYEHSGYDFSTSLRGRFGRALAPFASSHAHAQHHRHSDVSFSDGFGSRWDKARR